MKRVSLIGCIMLLISPTVYSQSDEEILEAVRVNAVAIFLDQASFTLPDSFHNSGLAPSNKERLIEQWANASGACFANALAEYAKTTDVPLSEIVDDDGTFLRHRSAEGELQNIRVADPHIVILVLVDD